jgi:hypothetical protein
MNADPNITLVDGYVNDLQGIKAMDRKSAIQAFSQLAIAVNQINQTLAATGSDRSLSPTSGLIEKLKEWVEKLVPKVEEIAKAFGETTSFSISIGVPISVTLNFPSYKDTTTK